MLVAVILIFSLYPAIVGGSAKSDFVLCSHLGGLGQLWVPGGGYSAADPGPQADPLNASTRAIILGFIATNPGIYLRGVSEEMGLALGDVQYHLWILIKNGEIVDRRDGRFRRFFESGKYSEMEQKVISALRQDTPGRILVILAVERPVSHMKLAETLGLTSQAVTWQIGRLRSIGIIEVVTEGDAKTYRLTQGVRETIERYLAEGQTWTARLGQVQGNDGGLHESVAKPCPVEASRLGAASPA